MTRTDEARWSSCARVVAILRETPRALHIWQRSFIYTNKPITLERTYVQKTWKQSLEKAGIEGVCIHDLRHDFVTRAMRSEGMPLMS